MWKGITRIGVRLRRSKGVHGVLDVVVVKAAAGESGGDASVELGIEGRAPRRFLLGGIGLWGGFGRKLFEELARDEEGVVRAVAAAGGGVDGASGEVLVDHATCEAVFEAATPDRALFELAGDRVLGQARVVNQAGTLKLRHDAGGDRLRSVACDQSLSQFVAGAIAHPQQIDCGTPGGVEIERRAWLWCSSHGWWGLIPRVAPDSWSFRADQPN